MSKNSSDLFAYKLPKLYQRPFIKGALYTRKQIIELGWADPDKWNTTEEAWRRVDFELYLTQIEQDANTNGN